MQDVARTHDYDVLIANSDHLYENEKHFCEAVMRRPVDGVIMAPEHLTYEDIDDLITITNTPIAALGQHINHPKAKNPHGHPDSRLRSVAVVVMNDTCGSQKSPYSSSGKWE